MARTNSNGNKDSSANLGFEAKLWLAADKLRNNMDAAEYKHVVLGLIFLKYISDTFEEHRAKLLAGKDEYAGANPEDPDEYKAENVFWVPADARWSHLQGSAKLPTIGKTVDDAMVAIERDNLRLKGVLPKDYARPGLDKHRLGELIDLIGTIALIDPAGSSGRESAQTSPGNDQSRLTSAATGADKKTHRSVDLLGRVYEYFLMRHGQTKGIPQGSTLMDFISELVLGYADLELRDRLKAAGITEFRILRYRDDYRIFVQSPQIGEAILKCLTEVLIDLGLKLNASKTTGAQLVVSNAIKADKRAWLRGRQGDPNLQKHLLVIHAHGHDFPNAGSLTVALTHFHERLNATKRINNPLVLISIATDIAYHSPKAFPVCSAIISKLLSVLPTKAARVEAIQKIHAKLSQLPNTGHMEAWLQRISHSFVPNLCYKETLCRLVKGDSVDLWNNDWITSATLKAAIDPAKIVNKAKLRSLKPIVRPKEIELFASERY
jgi:hypothetical protein